jgi:hypothetical protein
MELVRLPMTVEMAFNLHFPGKYSFHPGFKSTKEEVVNCLEILRNFDFP